MNAQRKVVSLHPDRVDEEGHPRTTMGQKIKAGMFFIKHYAICAIKIILSCLLILFKPFVLLIAFLTFILFAITIITGFIVGAEDFPRWEMLALSVGLFMSCVIYEMFLLKIQNKF
jgi:hypothetical protein